ncbi:MAG: glycosyltransferase family 4 protein [Chloroflexi bacterium]|nr:glycosyltransferase family 4 protein [Chloroflexota bacterium]
MRILFITGEYPPMQGGVADYTRALARALTDQGAQVAVFTSQAAREAPKDAGIEVYARAKGWGWRTWRVLNAVVERWRPDIAHIQYQTAAYHMHPAINLWPRFHRHPTAAVTFHDLREPYLFPKAHPLRRWVTHTLAKSAALAITTNPEDTAALRAARGDVVEIPIGSNIPCAPPADFERARWRARWHAPANAALIAYFGFLNASKGGKTLIDVLAMLVEQGRDAHLLMIGGRVGASDPTNDAYLQQVEAHIAAKGLRERVHWTDHLPPEQVSAAFLASDLVLLPYRDGVSYRRGSFMAALEHGRAVVTTPPRVAYPDLIPGHTLLLAPADDIPALTRAVASILDNPTLRQRLESNARELARRFTWDRIAERSLMEYERVLRGR